MAATHGGRGSGERRFLLERDEETGITLNNPARRNSYDAAMRRRMAEHLDDLAEDDAIKVVHLRGADGIFSTGADMGNAYAWYGDGARDDAKDGSRRPRQRRRR